VHEWQRSADRAIWGMVNITVGSGSGGCTIVLATPQSDGPSRARDLIAAIGVKPVTNRSRTLNRMDFVRYFESGADATRPRAFVAGSDIVGEMTPAAAESIVAATSELPQSAGAASGRRRRLGRHRFSVAAPRGVRSVVCRDAIAGVRGRRERVAGESA
jgi:hypothetical protein